MDLELIKDIYNLHIKGFEGLDFNVIRKDNYEITYNKNIKDCYSNFISNFDVRDKQEFEIIINEADKNFSKINRTTAIYLIPFMKELYDNRAKYFETDKYELISTEAWQIYNDFSKLDDINTNCNLNKIYGIYSLAIKKEYRSKGIGKEVLKQQLQMCKSKNIDIAYLQTELGFYPNKMYKKFGFEDLCVVYYYLRK